MEFYSQQYYLAVQEAIQEKTQFNGCGDLYLTLKIKGLLPKGRIFRNEGDRRIQRVIKSVNRNPDWLVEVDGAYGKVVGANWSEKDVELTIQQTLFEGGYSRCREVEKTLYFTGSDYPDEGSFRSSITVYDIKNIVKTINGLI